MLFITGDYNNNKILYDLALAKLFKTHLMLSVATSTKNKSVIIEKVM